MAFWVTSYQRFRCGVVVQRIFALCVVSRKLVNAMPDQCATLGTADTVSGSLRLTRICKQRQFSYSVKKHGVASRADGIQRKYTAVRRLRFAHLYPV
jgi:hypothetical protein